MNTIQISKANALQAYNDMPAKRDFLSNLLGKEHFLRPAIERIKSYEDACSDQSIKVLNLSAFNFLPAADRKYAFASHRVITIIKSLNEGWVPDWKDSNQPKYYVWYRNAGSGAGFSFSGSDYDRSRSYVGSRLLLKTSDLAVYAGKQFTAIYDQYLNG